MIPKYFSTWTDMTKLKFLEGLSPVTSGVKLRPCPWKEYHSNNETWWWQCDGLKLLSCFSIWETSCNWSNHEFCSLPEKSGGQCFAPWRVMQQTIIWNTWTQIHLWLAPKKQNNIKVLEWSSWSKDFMFLKKTLQCVWEWARIPANAWLHLVLPKVAQAVIRFRGELRFHIRMGGNR